MAMWMASERKPEHASLRSRPLSCPSGILSALHTLRAPQGERRGEITTGGPASPLDSKEVGAACGRPTSEHSALRARPGTLHTACGTPPSDLFCLRASLRGSAREARSFALGPFEAGAGVIFLAGDSWSIADDARTLNPQGILLCSRGSNGCVQGSELCARGAEAGRWLFEACGRVCGGFAREIPARRCC